MNKYEENTEKNEGIKNVDENDNHIFKMIMGNEIQNISAALQRANFPTQSIPSQPSRYKQSVKSTCLLELNEQKNINSFNLSKYLKYDSLKLNVAALKQIHYR